MPIARYCKKCQTEHSWPVSDRTKVTTCTYCGTAGALCFISDTAFLAAGEKPAEPDADLPRSPLPIETFTEAIPVKRGRKLRSSPESFSNAVFNKSPDLITANDIASLSASKSELSTGALVFLDGIILSVALAGPGVVVAVDCSKTRVADAFQAATTLKTNGFEVDTTSLVAKQQLHVSWSPTGAQANDQDEQAG